MVWWSINLCQRCNNADIPYWDTSWAEEAPERGSSLNQIKACLPAEVWEAAPWRGCIGNEITQPPGYTVCIFIHCTYRNVQPYWTEFECNETFIVVVKLFYFVWMHLENDSLHVQIIRNFPRSPKFGLWWFILYTTSKMSLCHTSKYVLIYLDLLPSTK